MYRSELHELLAEALEAAKWTRSTKNEDNFRQVLCANLYKRISPNNVEIPSTRSGHGDIRIFGRRLELKYANGEKGDTLEAVLEDFDLLLQDKIEFCLVVLRLDVTSSDDYLHSVIKVPSLAKGKPATRIGQHTLNGKAYCGPAIFLGAVYPHKVGSINPRTGKGKNATAYLSFEQAHGIERSCFLEVADRLVHCDVLGSREDGFLAFLFKLADGLQLADLPNTASDIVIPHAAGDGKLAESRRANVQRYSQKFGNDSPCALGSFIEESVIVFKI
jgi:hypothetical protein